ncbi:hypothetical protein BYT27DRAFT_7213830 [Phlegmacium glaucopus]|nr:hypothetical protein BYT27DRAFT_7213830 [Phlegmacium glaucopus]
MPGPRKQKKGKSKHTAPNSPPASQKPPNSKLMLRVPRLSSAMAQQAVPTTAVSPRTPELAPEAGPLCTDEDSDIYMPEIPYVPSPRQQLIDQFWEDHDTNTANRKEDPGSILLPNGAPSHPQNVEAPAVPGGKRKASTDSLECTPSVNTDSDDSDLDLSIRLAVSKKA